MKKGMKIKEAFINMYNAREDLSEAVVEWSSCRRTIKLMPDITPGMYDKLKAADQNLERTARLFVEASDKLAIEDALEDG